MNNSEEKNNFEELIQLVTFKLNDEEFGIDIFKVREINKMIKITRVPDAPHFVEGVVNLRGKVTPVVDLRSRLGLPKKENQNDCSIVVVETEDNTIGLVVDEVREVLRINSDITEPPSEIVAGINSDYVTSIAKLDERMLILLDLIKVLSFTKEELMTKAAV